MDTNAPRTRQALDQNHNPIRLSTPLVRAESRERPPAESRTVRGNGEHFVEGPIYYRLSDDNTGPELLLQVFMERGWQPWESRGPPPPLPLSKDDCSPCQTQWHVWWRHGFSTSVYRRLKNNQVVNHIARANGLCRKDTLARTLHKMHHAFPQVFDFSPPTFILPCEYTKLVAEYTKIMYRSRSTKSMEDLSPGGAPADNSNASSVNIWICKPTGSSQGKGISIFENLHELTYGGSAVVQRYLERPLLIGGYKCDIRLYVLVTSFLPLSIYIYTEGIVRFGTEKYCLDSLDNPYAHLTNTSINKISPGYKLEKNRVGTGCKWTLKQLRRHLKCSDRNDWLLWQKVNILVTLTLLSQVGKFPDALTTHQQYASNVQPSRIGTTFELYGFDILVDQNLTPWLLEVNRCPSLTYDCDVDRVVKKPLLHQMFDLLGPPKVSQSVDRVLRPLELNYQSGINGRRRGSLSPRDPMTDRFNFSNGNSLCEECDDVSVSACSSPSYETRSTTSKNITRCSRTLQTRSRAAPMLGSMARSGSIMTRNESPAARGHRRRSLSCFKDSESRSLIAEEISREAYIPLTSTTTFQRLRNQFISNCSNSSSYLSWGSSVSSLESISKPMSYRSDRRPQNRQPSRCGDWIRTFPYNAATLHGSRDHVYMRSLVAEVSKLRKCCEKAFKDFPKSEEKDLCNQIQKLFWKDHIPWLPKNS